MSPKIRVNSTEWEYNGCESRITLLSLALKFTDQFNNQSPLGHLFFSIKGKKITLLQNPSGYFLIRDTDLLTGTKILTIESEYYITREKEITIPDPALPPRNPVIPIDLYPNSRYPFPSHATLVRGTVKDPAPVSGADVRVRDRTPALPPPPPDVWAEATKTDVTGDYVLFFRDVKEAGEDISIQAHDGARLKEIPVKIFPRKTIIVQFSLP